LLNGEDEPPMRDKSINSPPPDLGNRKELLVVKTFEELKE
jgi:hypothetical protein